MPTSTPTEAELRTEARVKMKIIIEELEKSDDFRVRCLKDYANEVYDYLRSLR